MTVNELALYLENKIPSSLSEPWDNDGNMVIPDGSAEVTGVLCALDCTSYAISLAMQKGCNVILTHHPLVFHPLKRLVENDSVGQRVLKCVRNGISVLSYHTRLDIIEGGVNDCLAECLGLKDADPFLPFARISSVGKQPFADYLAFVSAKLGVEKIQAVNANGWVNRVAILSGSGKGELRTVIASGADTFITGEIPHDEMIDCKELGLNLICATHYATERIVTDKLTKIVQELGIFAENYLFDEVKEYGI